MNVRTLTALIACLAAATLAAQPCPFRAGALGTDFFPVRMAASGDTLFVAAGEAGLAVLSGGEDGVPAVRAMLDTPGLAVDLAVAGALVVVADGTAGLQVVDVTDPARPRLAGGLPMADAEAVAVAGRYAYVLSPGEGLVVADLADPARPLEAAVVPWEGTPTVAYFSLHASDGLLFATDLYSGLWIYDLSDPVHPVRLSHTIPPGLAFDAAPAGDRLAVAAGSNLLLYDIGDPSAPVEVCRFALPTDAYAVEVRGEYAFVADDWGGLRVVNIAGSPFEAGYSFTSQDAFALALREGTAYVATNFLTAKGIDTFAVAGCGARIIPAAAHADGVNGTRWRTDLVLTNPGAAAVAADLRFIPSIGEPPAADGPPVTVPAGASVLLEDVVGTQWGLATAAGAVAIEGATGLVAASRTYTEGAAGTAGQSVPSFPSDEAARAGEEVYCLPLSRNAAYRSNVGVVNISNQQYWLGIKAFDHFGNFLGEEYFYIMPWDAFQKNDILGLFTGTDQEGAFVVISAAFDTNPPAGPLFFAYASVVDNRTGDPSFLPAVRPYGTTQDLFLPVFARARGAYGTAWKTELALLNFTGRLGANLTWSSSLGTFTAPAYISLGALAFSPDAAAQYFPSVEGDARGTLLIAPFQGPGMVAAARVYNETPAGTYGQTVPPLAPVELLQDGERGLLTGLIRTAAYRTNAGFSSFGSTLARLRLRMLDAAGAPLAEMPFEVEPGVNRQIDDVFAALGIAGEVPLARLEVLMEENGPVYAYASVVDNRSGDAVFIPAIKVR